MHIPDGVLSVPVLAAGWAVAAGGTALGLRRTPIERVPEVAVLSAGFFVASLVQAPVGPASVHLVLNGLLGVVLGWAAFPAVLVGLLLQAVMFEFGGLTTLGVNTANMALPAVACYYLFGPLVRRRDVRWAAPAGLAAGAAGVAMGCLLVGLSYLASDPKYVGVAGVMLVYSLPVLAADGVITGAVVSFLRRVRPEVLIVMRRRAPEEADDADA